MSLHKLNALMRVSLQQVPLHFCFSTPLGQQHSDAVHGAELDGQDPQSGEAIGKFNFSLLRGYLKQKQNM